MAASRPWVARAESDVRFADLTASSAESGRTTDHASFLRRDFVLATCTGADEYERYACRTWGSAPGDQWT